METKEDFIKNVKEFVSKNKFGLQVLGVASALFCIVVPVIINIAYDVGKYHPLFKTYWGASDILSYYGTLLGASATIIAVTWTIITSKNAAEIDRKNQMILNNRNLSLKYATDFIDAIDYKVISMEIIKFVPELTEMLNNKNNIELQKIRLFVKSLMDIGNDINTAFAKYQLFENIENTSIFEEIWNYKESYYKDIMKFVKILEKTMGSLNDQLKNYDNEKIEEFLENYQTEIKKLKIGLIDEQKIYENKYSDKYKELLRLVRLSIPEIEVNDYAQEKGSSSQDN